MSFSHHDSEGAARMVEVGEKAVVRRTAIAGGYVQMSPETVALLKETALPKGEVLSTARIAGVMAAKKTPELIPLCHGLNLTSVNVAALTVYDMCKAVDKGMVIGEIKLLRKTKESAGP